MTADVDSGLVIGILAQSGRGGGGAAQSVGKIELGDRVLLAIPTRHDGQTALDHAQALQRTYPDSHILLLDENVFVPSTFIETVESQIRFFADKDVAWGVIGNSGITFPFFTPVRNLLAATAPPDRFAGVLPAALLDSGVLLIHRDVKLSAITLSAGCPPDAPLGDLATLAAWEAEKPCWICNLPVYLDVADGQPTRDREVWARYLATRYNNASFVTAFGTITLPDHAADAKDFYYSQIEPVLSRATRHLDVASLSVLLLATYHDADVFDRCLMSVVSQFQRPETVYIIGLDRLDDTRREAFYAIVERYRYYLSIHWAEEELPGADTIARLTAYIERLPKDGYSILAYDTFVLFPQAVRQICEFLQLTLRDPNVLPITTAEISRLHRSVETRFSSQPRAFFREVEKLGFTHEERWLSSEPSSTLHFTFPNRFLLETSFSGIDLFDLGSILPQRLLSEPLSFYLIERGAGYMSFQKPSPDESASPLAEAGTPFHLANKAGSLLAARSNAVRYSIDATGIAPVLSYRDEGEAARQQRARLAELEAYRAQTEQEIEGLRHVADQQRDTLEGQANSLRQQEVLLNKFRSSWYFKARQRMKQLRAVRGIYRTLR